MENRGTHLAWCKAAALEYVDAGELADAVASMASDLGKHPETAALASPVLINLGMLAVLAGHANGVRRWIEGFR